MTKHTTTDVFDLTVQVPIEDWAYAQRRVKYLEAVLVQLLRDKERLQEWYNAKEIAALCLPGIPSTQSGVSRYAGANHWRRKNQPYQGGKRYLYHYTSLPVRAFDALIARILNIDPPRVDGREQHPSVNAMVDAVDLPVKLSLPDNTAPPWMLPLMRILKQGKAETVGDVIRELLGALPNNIECPDSDELYKALDKMDMLAK